MKTKTHTQPPASGNGRHGGNGKNGNDDQNGGNGSHGGPAASMAGKGGKPKTGPMPPVLAKLLEEQPLSAAVPTGHYDSGAEYGQIAYADGDPTVPVNNGGIVKLGLSKLTNAQFSSAVHAHNVCMEDNPHFPAPQPPATELVPAQTAFEAILTQITNKELELRSLTSVRDQMRKDLDVMMNGRAGYVQQASNGNKAVIESSGLGVRNPRTNVHVLNTPGNLRMTLTVNAGQVRIQWNRVTHAMTYELQCSLDVTPRVWETIQASSRTSALKTLVVGHVYAFRVCAVGSPGRSEWSSEIIRGVA